MIYLVGAGIGRWDYISVKGLELIKICDVIIYDRLIDNKLLDFARTDCIKLYAGKSTDNHSLKQSEINKLIAEYGKKYNIVVRLKGGDPFVFGRGGEEAEVCIENNLPFELVPGISSSIGVPELCGIPVTYRALSQDLHIVTGHTANKDNINYKALANLNGTLVFLMGVKNIGRISAELIKYGKDIKTPVAFIENGGTKNERVLKTTLEKAESCVKENSIIPPSIILIGKTAALDFKHNKKSVAIIGTESFKKRLSQKLYNYNVIDAGTLLVKKYDFNIDLECDIIVFTSRNGVNIFMNYLKENSIDIRKLYNKKFAVIGKGTYDALCEYGIYADIMPEKYTASELSKKLSEYNGKKLILRAEKGSDELYRYIDNYADIKIYDIIYKDFEAADTDYIIFGSSSAVDYYCSAYKINSKIIAIGEITAKRLSEFGYNSYVADEYNIDGIVRKLEEIEK